MGIKTVGLFSYRFLFVGLGFYIAVAAPNVLAQINSPELMCNVSEGVPSPSKPKLARSTSKNKLSIHSAPVTRLYPASIVKLQGRVFLVGRSGNSLAEQQMLYEGDELKLNDVVQTSHQSFISIRLSDGTISMLPSNSRVQLSQSSPTVGRYILQSGEIQNKVIKRSRVRSNTFEIQTPGSMIGVRGTDFWVRRLDQGASVALAVEEGKVWVQPRHSCAAPTVVDAGFGVLIDLQNQKVPLLPAPTLKNPDTPQPDPLLHFVLQPVAGAVRYRAQIVGDVNVLDTLFEQYANQPDLTFDVPNLQNGYYYVKLAAFNHLGIQGSTKTYLFLRNRNTRVE